MAAKTTTSLSSDAESIHLKWALKASRMREAIPRLAERARGEGWTHEKFLAACLEREVTARAAHGGELRVKAALFPARKSLEEFDFAHDTVTAAMIDRLVHHAEIVNIKGDSYRLEDHDLGHIPPAHTSHWPTRGVNFQPLPGVKIRSVLTALMRLVRRQANLAGGIVTVEAPVPVARTVDDLAVAVDLGLNFGFALADFAPAVEGAPKAKASPATQASAHLPKRFAIDDAFPPYVGHSAYSTFREGTNYSALRARLTSLEAPPGLRSGKVWDLGEQLRR